MVIPVMVGVGSVVQLPSFPITGKSVSFESNNFQTIRLFSILSSISFIYQFFLCLKAHNHIPHTQGLISINIYLFGVDNPSGEG